MRMWEKTHHLLSDYLHLLKQWKIEPRQAEGGSDTVQKLKDEFTDTIRSVEGFSEHYYGENVDVKLQEMIERVIQNLDAFIASEWHSKVQKYFITAKNIFIEKPKIPDYEQMKVDVHKIPELTDISVLASPDFGVVIDDNNYLILDWKSGKEPFESDWISDQLKVYALKMLLKKWTLTLGDVKIQAYEVYLPSMQSRGGDLIQKDIDDVIQKIIQDVDFQKQFLVDKDAINNIALPHKNFPRTTSAKKCEHCTFRKVCFELKTME